MLRIKHKEHMHLVLTVHLKVKAALYIEKSEQWDFFVFINLKICF
jgi:hypothetical protein